MSSTTKVSATGSGTANTATVKSESEKKKSFDKLLTKLGQRGVSLLEFSVVKENRRKKMLQDDYQAIKDETGWLYDERVEIPADVLAKEKELADAKLQAASKLK